MPVDFNKIQVGQQVPIPDIAGSKILSVTALYRWKSSVPAYWITLHEFNGWYQVWRSWRWTDKTDNVVVQGRAPYQRATTNREEAAQLFNAIVKQRVDVGWKLHSTNNVKPDLPKDHPVFEQKTVIKSDTYKNEDNTEVPFADREPQW